MVEHDHEQRISWNERLVLAVESKDHKEAKCCREVLAKVRHADAQSSAASTGQDNDWPSPNAKAVPALDPNPLATAMSHDPTAGALAPLPPIPSDSEDSSSEDASQTDDVNEAEIKWLNLVDSLTKNKLTWDKSLTDQDVWEEAYRERWAVAKVGWWIQLIRKDPIRRSAIAALFFDHAYLFNAEICLNEWRLICLSEATLDKYFTRKAKGRRAEEGEGPKKPQCRRNTYNEALRSTSTLREMLREHNASANAIWLEERQEPVQCETLVEVEENPVP